MRTISMVKSPLFLGLIVAAIFIAFWLRADARAAQDRKVRVLVYNANAKAESVAQSVEAKFNSTMRYEVVNEQGQPDLVVAIICAEAEDSRNSLGYARICSSTVQVISGNIGIPLIWGNVLVFGTPEHVATSIFEGAVNSSSDEKLEAARSSFHHAVYGYCKQLNCSQDVK